MGDALEKLQAAGIVIKAMPEPQKKVLSELSDEEVRVLTAVNERVRAASEDVEGYMASDNGYVFW